MLNQVAHLVRVAYVNLRLPPTCSYPTDSPIATKPRLCSSLTNVAQSTMSTPNLCHDALFKILIRRNCKLMMNYIIIQATTKPNIWYVFFQRQREHVDAGSSNNMTASTTTQIFSLFDRGVSFSKIHKLENVLIYIFSKTYDRVINRKSLAKVAQIFLFGSMSEVVWVKDTQQWIIVSLWQRYLRLEG